ncbi:hypothetical protein [Kitasatospora sp. NPDC058190]|uniref:hypothetical protein n=1 Tax=Kitasatospora sp. NPDC058190 TaxID=3346371 RepID=UPI0036D92CB8
MPDGAEPSRIDWDRGRHYTVDIARPSTAPDEPLPILVSDFGPKAAELAGRIGDGFVTMTPDADLVGAFPDGGGEGKKVAGGVKVCWSSNREKAVDVVHVDRVPPRRCAKPTTADWTGDVADACPGSAV